MKDKRGTKSPATSDGQDGRPETDVGQALRSAYSATVSEGTPQEFLDLLGKLN